ncbi:MAG TPA: hypothetical protein VHA06_18525 [Candidatus Angelobacter sp.]|jgi:hypothetical protein|nr:hypothetical protein [Candidatus Angelobacter sp.]
MAETQHHRCTRRKFVKDYPRINNCRVNPEAFATLNRIAGPNALGVAIEYLCQREELVSQLLQFMDKKPNETEAVLPGLASAQVATVA